MPSELVSKLFKRRAEIDCAGQTWESAPVKSNADASQSSKPHLAGLKFDAPAAKTWLQSLEPGPEEDELAEAIADGLIDRRQALPEHLHPAVSAKDTEHLASLAKSLADMEKALDNERAGLSEQRGELARREAEVRAREKAMKDEKKRQQEREAARRNYPQPKWLENIEGVMNIAVVGNSGVGKSLLINKLRRVRPQAHGWAPVGVCETTQEPTKYPFPEQPQVCLWDLPGAGTEAVPSNTYISDMGLRYFDKVLICTAGRFTSMEVELRKELEKHRVPYLMVRTKVDIDAMNNREDNGLNEADTLALIREDLHKIHGVEKVYLISSRDPGSFDMPSLVSDLFPHMQRGLDPNAKAFVPDAPAWNEPWSMPVMFSPVVSGLQGRWSSDEAVFLVNGKDVHVAVGNGLQNALCQVTEMDNKVWWSNRWYVTEECVNRARLSGELWWMAASDQDAPLMWKWAD